MATTLNNNNDSDLLLPLLPEDVLVEILSRLPVESIIRFKCICKSWYALFTNPNFAAKHLRLAKANQNPQHIFIKRYLQDDEVKNKWLACLFSDDDNALNKNEREDMVIGVWDYGLLELIGHCDGIVALALYQSHLVIVLNPATRQSRTLPTSSFHPIPYGYKSYIDSSFQPVRFDRWGNRIYDVEVVNNFIGFGYDPKTNDYKVVRDVAFHWRKTRMITHRVEVFSIGTDSCWREIDGGDALSNIKKGPSGDSNFEQYFDGFFYWWGCDRVDLNWFMLISFDMANEVFRKIPMPAEKFSIDPSKADDLNFVPTIGVYNNECIALYVIPFVCEDVNCMDVWVMKEFGSWTKQLTIIASVAAVTRALMFWKNDEELLYDEDEHLYSYNLINQKSKSVPLHGGGFAARRFLKTIVSVNTREEIVDIT